MIRYRITELTPKRPGKGVRIVLAPIEDSRATYLAYVKALRAMNRALVAEVRTGIIPVYRVDRLTVDVDRSTFQRIRALAVMLSRVASDTVERVLGLESRRHTERFMDEARKALGIDLGAIVRAEDLDEYLRRAVARNTSLITSLSEDMVKRIEQTVIANELNGRSVATLKKALVEQFGIVDRRAQLIARDQTAKLNSDMNRIRQTQAGIESYEWATSHDERVRPLHQGLDGDQYKWGERTGAEDGLPPGQPIQCRCVARGVVEF